MALSHTAARLQTQDFSVSNIAVWHMLSSSAVYLLPFGVHTADLPCRNSDPRVCVCVRCVYQDVHCSIACSSKINPVEFLCDGEDSGCPRHCATVNIMGRLERRGEPVIVKFNSCRSLTAGPHPLLDAFRPETFPNFSGP